MVTKHETSPRRFYLMNMLLILLTLIACFSLIIHWKNHSIHNAATKTFSKKTTSATCEGNAIERSCKLLQESLEIRNKRQFRFRAILCSNPKWRSCFHYEQLSVPIDGSANFKFITPSRPNECNKYHYWTHQFE